MKPPRVPLYGFPDVVLHADETTAKGHPQYRSAKAGDLAAADVLTSQLVSAIAVQRLGTTIAGHSIEIVPIHALESQGVNEIPAALTNVLSRLLGPPVNSLSCS